MNPRAGNTFAAALRSLMRQDPNVIMVGEIRDEEVAQIVGQAAYTGHLVLTSMHTVDAATAITRLSNLGPRTLQDRREPVGRARAAAAARALSGLPAGSRRGRRTPPRGRHQDSVGPCLGRLRLPALQSHRLSGARAGRRAADALRRASRRHRPRRHGARDSRRPCAPPDFPRCATTRCKLVAAGITSIEEVNRVLTDDADSAHGAARERKRVLVTDDEPITRMLVKLLLEREHFEVLEATNGRDAVEIATTRTAGPVAHRPEHAGDGRLRGDWRTCGRTLRMATLPIIVLTSEEGPGVEHRVLELGADDYIVKPFDPSILLSRVNAVFRRLKVMAA